MEVNKIYNENCLETMSRMPDGLIDLTVTSPPYDNLRKYNGYNFDFESVIKELVRVTKQGGVVVWVVGDATINGSETGSSFKQALYAKEVGFKLHDTMIYQKNSLTFPDTRRYYQCFEYMFIWSKGVPKVCNQIKDKPNKRANEMITGSYRSIDGSIKKMSGSKKKRVIKDFGVRWNIWKYDTGWNSSYTEKWLRGHPAIFPEKLASDHIVSWSNKNDLVYDPFMGSGTTAKMAILNNREFIGSEISKEYCEFAERRINGIELTNLTRESRKA